MIYVLVDGGRVRYLIGVCVFKKRIDFVDVPLFVHDYNATTFVGGGDDDIQVLG